MSMILAAAAATAVPIVPIDFAGVAVVADARTGRIVAGGSFGGVDPKLRARWRLASFTKQVVATLIMQSVETGKLRLDAPVSDWLPRFVGRSITLRQLLTHGSGIADPETSDAIADDYNARDEQGQRAFCSDVSRAEPGGAVHYNNCDFVVLGEVLERAEGKPWFRLVQQRINARAGSRFTLDDRHAVAGTFNSKPELKLSAPAYGAAGGLHGTVRDIVAFDRALVSGKLLSPASRAELWRGDPKRGTIALGQWSYAARLTGCVGPQAIVERRGQIGGVQLRNLIFADRNRILIVLTPRGEFDFGEIWQGRGGMFDIASRAICP